MPTKYARYTVKEPSLCLFFMQAEAAIRDLIVTGVQTCALPICPRGLETRDVVGVGPHRVPAKTLEGVADLVDRAAIEFSRGDEFVAGPQQLLHDHDLRGV